MLGPERDNYRRHQRGDHDVVGRCWQSHAQYQTNDGSKQQHQHHVTARDKLDELSIEYRFEKVETAFGETNIVVTGNPENPPLVLVHGSNGCAPIALDIYPNLTKKYQVFAVDVIAQPNLSSETRPSMKDASYGKWMNEVFCLLNLLKYKYHIYMLKVEYH